MNKESIKESTENYIDVILKQAEDKAGVSMTEALVESTSFLDKVSNSLLIISGAAITLSIGNAEALILVLGKGSFKALIILLLVSAIIGFIAKACHAIALMYITFAKDILIKMKVIFDEFNAFEEEQIENVKEYVTIETRSLSLDRVLASYIDTLPKFLQKRTLKSISNKKHDSNKAQRVASTAAFFHFIFFGLQALFVLAAFSAAVFGIE